MFFSAFIAVVVISEIGFLFVIIMGWGRAKSKEFIIEAIAQIRRNNFKGARQLILTATRFDGRLLQNAEVKLIYDFVVAERVDESHMSLDAFAETVRSWPQSRLEVIAIHPLTKLFVVAVIFGGFLLKLTNVFGP